jgi:hypothetical protein
MNLSEWIIGPQLIGFACGLIGLVQIYFPPKKINGLDTYLTSSAEKNEQILEEARRFFPRYLFKVSLVLFISGIAITAILHVIITSAQLREGLNLMFMYISLPSIPIVISKTGQHIEKFNK